MFQILRYKGDFYWTYALDGLLGNLSILLGFRNNLRILIHNGLFLNGLADGGRVIGQLGTFKAATTEYLVQKYFLDFKYKNILYLLVANKIINKTFSLQPYEDQMLIQKYYTINTVMGVSTYFSLANKSILDQSLSTSSFKVEELISEKAYNYIHGAVYNAIIHNSKIAIMTCENNEIRTNVGWAGDFINN